MRKNGDGKWVIVEPEDVLFLDFKLNELNWVNMLIQPSKVKNKTKQNKTKQKTWEGREGLRKVPHKVVTQSTDLDAWWGQHRLWNHPNVESLLTQLPFGYITLGVSVSPLKDGTIIPTSGVVLSDK